MIIILPYVIALIFMALCIHSAVYAKADLDANVCNLYAMIEHTKMSRLAIKRDIQLTFLISIMTTFEKEAI